MTRSQFIAPRQQWKELIRENLMNNRIVHFEIHCPDVERAIKFYQNVFDWKVQKWEGPEPYYLAQTGDKSKPGIDGGLMPSRDGQPRTVNTLQVSDVDAAVKKVLAHGGKNVVPKMPIPGVGWVAYCTDPGGNIFGVFLADEKAK